LPIIKIDISNFIESISSKFNGQITNSSEKSELRKVIFDVISSLFDNILIILEKETKNYKDLLENIKFKFSDTLLETINNEFDIILKQFENKEKEINKSKEILQVFEECLINIDKFSFIN
jgi:hypothetical protein